MTLVRVDVTPDTPEWLEERKNSVGASQAGPLIGLSEFGETPLSVYLSKLGRGIPFDPTLAYVTHAAEPLIDGWVREFHPELGTIEPGYMARNSDHPWLHATFDRVLLRPDGKRVPLQFKTSSPFMRDKWDQGPLPQYLAQEDVECLVLDADEAVLVVWHYGTDFTIYRLTPDRGRQLALSAAAKELMERVADRRPPAASLGDDLAALYPQSLEKAITADTDAFDAWAMLVETSIFKRQSVAEFDEQIADAKFQLEEFMRDATHLIDPTNSTLLHTWKETKSGQRRHFTPKKEEQRFKR